jgi:4-nitrophenyl phosphatase
MQPPLLNMGWSTRYWNIQQKLNNTRKITQNPVSPRNRVSYIKNMIFDPAKIRALILDMDGVLWRSNQPIGDLHTIFSDIEELGWKVVLATNNATKSIEQFLGKLGSFGVNLEYWQVINSAQATAHYLSQLHPEGGPTYIVGEPGLVDILEAKGFKHSEEKPIAVVVALDHSINYEKLRTATLLIRSGVPFIGTNPDRTFPTPDGQVPGAGSILAAIEAATDIQPLVIGKPNPAMYQFALERMGTTPVETLVVGDRLETDIAGAQNLGSPCALVLSGVSSEEAAWAWEPSPDIIANNLTDVIRELKLLTGLDG